MTITQLAAVARKRYGKGKDARRVDPTQPKPDWGKIVFEVVKEAGFGGDEISKIISEVNISNAEHRKHWVRSWGRKAS